MSLHTPHAGGADLRDPASIQLVAKGDAHVVQLKQKAPTARILVNLNWATGAGAKRGFLSGFFGGGSRAVDLDLGCFYELKPSGMAPGDKSVIDGLQFARSGGPQHRVTRQGCLTQRPWIWHSGDDRSGAGCAEGETLLINPAGYRDLARMTLYAYIYEGTPRWSDTDAVVTIRVPGSPAIEVPMGRVQSNQTFCALANLVFHDDASIEVVKLMTFHNGHSDCDRAYRWGMRWTGGSK